MDVLTESPLLAAAIMAQGAISKRMFDQFTPKVVDSFAGIAVEAEYQLILQKKSRLPASKRAQIVHYMERKTN